MILLRQFYLNLYKRNHEIDNGIEKGQKSKHRLPKEHIHTLPAKLVLLNAHHK